jgi:hypothetical protein
VERRQPEVAEEHASLTAFALEDRVVYHTYSSLARFPHPAD